MSEQQSLFATGPTARPTDPRTSLAAGQKVPRVDIDKDNLSELQRWVMCAHLARLGLTDEEMCEMIPNRHPPTLIKRRTELTKAGLLVDSGRTRHTKRWREAVVWKRTEEAERIAGLRK